MILEGMVTTVGADGAVNIAPMGPRVDDAMERFVLRPFPTAKTYQNLCHHPEGVLHVSDDALLLARAAIGPVADEPLKPAHAIRGWIVANACRAYEFRVVSRDDSQQRAELVCEVVRVHRLRDFFGFNRAKHAVVEAAILATRVHLLPRGEILAEFERFRAPVAKTGGPRELEAFALLERYIQAGGQP